MDVEALKVFSKSGNPGALIFKYPCTASLAAQHAIVLCSQTAYKGRVCVWISNLAERCKNPTLSDKLLWLYQQKWLKSKNGIPVVPPVPP